jgi:hypothetical protein
MVKGTTHADGKFDVKPYTPTSLNDQKGNINWAKRVIACSAISSDGVSIDNDFQRIGITCTLISWALKLLCFNWLCGTDSYLHYEINGRTFLTYFLFFLTSLNSIHFENHFTKNDVSFIFCNSFSSCLGSMELVIKTYPEGKVSGYMNNLKVIAPQLF